MARSFDRGRTWSTDLLFDRTPDGEPFDNYYNAMNGTFVPLGDAEAMYVFGHFVPAPRQATAPTRSTFAGTDARNASDFARVSVAARLASSGDRSDWGQEESEAVGKQQGNLHAHLARRVDAGERPVAASSPPRRSRLSVLLPVATRPFATRLDSTSPAEPCAPPDARSQGSSGCSTGRWSRLPEFRPYQSLQGFQRSCGTGGAADVEQLGDGIGTEVVQHRPGGDSPPQRVVGQQSGIVDLE